MPQLAIPGRARESAERSVTRARRGGPATRPKSALAWWQIALAIVVFSAACAGFFLSFYREAKAGEIAALQKQQQIHARQAARGVEDFFETWKGSLTALSRMNEVVECGPAGRRQMVLFLEAHAGQIRTISRVDERGVILASYPFTEAEGSDISAQKHFAELKRELRPVVSDVFRTVQGFDGVALHVPVFKDSAFRGSLASRSQTRHVRIFAWTAPT